MMDATSFLDIVAGYANKPSGAQTSSAGHPNRTATIDPAYTAGMPKVLFDGEEDMSDREYTWNSSYTPVAGDRVFMVPVGTTFIIGGMITSTPVGGSSLVTTLASSGSNLNDCITPGVWHQPLTAGATAGTNYPENRAGLLEVAVAAPMIYQTYTGYSSGRMFWRGRYNTAWSAWAEVASKAYADALGTSANTANTIVRLDAAGRARVNAPSNALDIANKAYADSLVKKVPDAMAAGKVIIAGPVAAGGVSGSIAVTFPAGYFVGEPALFFGSNDPRVSPNVTGLSASGCNIRAFNYTSSASTTSPTIWWSAQQI